MNGDQLNYSITLFSSLVTLIGGVAAGWKFFQKRLNTAKGENHLLEAQKNAVEGINADLNIQLEKAVERCETYAASLPDSALKKAKECWTNGNDRGANDTVVDWIDREGDTISMLLLYRAEWAHKHAVGDDRSLGLFAAEAYATAAVALWPQNQQAVDLLDAIENYQDEVGPSQAPLTEALAEFDEKTEKLFEANLVAAANEAEKEASYRCTRGHYHLALPVVELAINLRIRTVGNTSVQTLGTEHLHASILERLGRYGEALSKALSVEQAYADHPARGPSHPHTLATGSLVAQILDALRRHDEALLSKALSLEKAHADHPALGLSHPNTLASGTLVARILHSLGHHDEALSKALSVEKSFMDHPALGPFHPKTLVCGTLVAQILRSLARHDEALSKALTLEKAKAIHPALGPSHPETLATGYLIAQILYALRRYDEALSKALTLEKSLTDHPALGPSHPDTLATGYLITQFLYALRRYDEALSKALSLEKAYADHPARGPSHPHTLAAGSLVAEIRGHLSDPH